MHLSFWLLILFSVTINASLMEYKAKDDNASIYGTLNIQCAPEVADILTQWVVKFQSLYPNVQSKLGFKSSTYSIKSVIQGQANIGLARRQIVQKEVDAFITKRGYAPTEIKVALDALVIYVHKDNKIKSLSIPQLDAIFSTTLNQGYPQTIDNWEELGGIKHPINIHLFYANSSTRKYFQQVVMKSGQFNTKHVLSDDYKELLALMSALANDTYGISFGGIQKRHHKVKALAIAQKNYFPTFTPNSETITSGKYPLTKFYYIYLDIAPDQKIEPLLDEFLKFILSREGQKMVSDLGRLRLSPQQVGVELSKIRR